MSNKYHARKVMIDGITFDSQAEGNRYLYLKSEQEAGRISGLECHPKFTLLKGRTWNGKRYRPVTYSPDFTYRDCVAAKMVAEDVKGGQATQTTAFKIKQKMLIAMLDESAWDFRIVEA